MPFHCIEFDLIQDEDGIIHFDFVDELGVVKSLPLHKSESFLKAHFYDTQSQMLALVTLSNKSSHSGFSGVSYNHISFKFLKFNQSQNSFQYLYQTGFQFDEKVLIENYTFHSTDKFQLVGTGQKGLLSFDLEHGSVSYSKSDGISVKEMSKLNMIINSNCEVTYESPNSFSLTKANQSETLFK
jgi:hypothetical protein